MANSSRDAAARTARPTGGTDEIAVKEQSPLGATVQGTTEARQRREQEQQTEARSSRDAAEKPFAKLHVTTTLRRRTRDEEAEDARAKEKAKVAEEAKVKAAGVGKRGPNKQRAEDASREEGLKKARHYPPRVEVDDNVTLKEIQDLLPAGCRASHDTLDSAWRVRAYEKSLSRSFTKWSPGGAAFEIIKKSWEHSLELGYEFENPFANLAIAF